MNNIQHYKPFSDKYKEYFAKTFSCKYNILEGAYRSSKTICNCFAWAAYLQRTHEKIHIIASQTIGLCKLTMLDSNGYGLLNILGNKARLGKFEGNEALFVKTDNGEKICIICSHGKSDSFRQIQGMSVGGIYAGELGLAYTDKEDETKDWVSVALSRLTASKDPFFIADLNPLSPSAYIYTHIERMSNATKPDGTSDFNFSQVSLFDNNALTKQQKESYASLFPKDSLLYKRNILGERAASVGIINQQFAANTSRYIVKKEDEVEFLKGRNYWCSIGVDFALGGEKSKYALCASLIVDDFRTIYVVKSALYDTKDKDSNYVGETFKQFLIDVKKKYKVRCCFCDYAQKVFIVDLRNICKQIAPEVSILDSPKGKIIDRIAMTISLVAKDRLFISENADTLISALSTATWDEKHQDQRKDDGSSDIDSLDAFEYSINKWQKKILLMNNK